MTVVAVDASRNRSGGIKAYLRGLIEEGDPLQHGLREVHLWTYRALADTLPERPWLVKHSPPALEGSILAQLRWQRVDFEREARQAGCDIALATDAATVSRFSPLVTVSQDMLAYEPGEAQRYGWGRPRWRIVALKRVTDAALRRSAGAVFLNEHAARVVQGETGPLARVAIIPHAMSPRFRSARWRPREGGPIRVLYVSNAAPYKHQWHVVHAVSLLRARGLDVQLELVGGGSGPAQARLEEALRRFDPRGEHVRQTGFVAPEALPEVLAAADVFAFASSCENMPVTLLEAMAVGLPIACSRRGPMPEILQDGGEYFDPEQPETIASALERLVVDPALRERRASRARELAGAFSWRRCSDETWAFLREIASAPAKHPSPVAGSGRP